MRILYAVHGYRPAWRVGGPVHSVPAVAERLARRGHEVTVVTAAWDLTEPLDVPTDKPVDVNGVSVHYFPTRTLAGGKPSPGKRDTFLFMPNLRPYLDGSMSKCDIAHAHLPFCYPTLALGRAAHRAGVPFCYHQRGVFAPERLAWRSVRKRLWLQTIELPLCRKATCLFALTPAEVESYRALGLTNRIELAPNGVDLASLAKGVPPEWLARLDGDVEILLFLGRIHPLKGVDALLDAFILLAGARPRCHLVLAGPDEVGIVRELRTRAANAGVLERLHTPGLVTGAAKAALLARADLFVLPSSAEGFSMAILEALAASTAVIASPACHFPELEAEGAGLIAEPEGPALAEAAGRLLADQAMRRRMGEAGHRLVQQRYAWDSIVDRFEAIYMDVVAQHRREAN
ncbi:MAG: glycosyltransferase [Sphingomonadaceae bacterium]